MQIFGLTTFLVSERVYIVATLRELCREALGGYSMEKEKMDSRTAAD